jgi:hypothetical protein
VGGEDVDESAVRLNAIHVCVTAEGAIIRKLAALALVTLASRSTTDRMIERGR